MEEGGGEWRRVEMVWKEGEGEEGWRKVEEGGGGCKLV